MTTTYPIATLVSSLDSVPRRGFTFFCGHCVEELWIDDGHSSAECPRCKSHHEYDGEYVDDGLARGDFYLAVAGLCWSCAVNAIGVEDQGVCIPCWREIQRKDGAK